MRRKTASRIVLAIAAAAPLAACLLDLPTPIVNDDAGLDGSNPDTGLPDGFTPDGMMMNDGTTDSGSDVVIPPFDGGGGCDAGICSFATFQLEPGHIEHDSTSLYFTLGADRIESAVISTKATGTILQNQGDFVSDLKVRNGYAYFTSIPGGSNNKLSRCQTTGCAPRYDYLSARPFFGVDSDGTNYVWFTVDAAMNMNGGIYRCSLTMMNCGTALRPLDNPRRIAADAANVYWFNAPGALSTCTAPACATATSANGFGVIDLTFDTTNVYWVDGSAVRMQPKGNVNGGSVLVSNANGGGNAFAIRSDGQNVYWLTKVGNMGTLRRCAISTGCMSTPADTLASNIADPTSLTIAGGEVFFTTVTGKAIWRVAK